MKLTRNRAQRILNNFLNIVPNQSPEVEYQIDVDYRPRHYGRIVYCTNKIGQSWIAADGSDYKDALVNFYLSTFPDKETCSDKEHKKRYEFIASTLEKEK